jgi:hypothetical protein
VLIVMSKNEERVIYFLAIIYSILSQSYLIFSFLEWKEIKHKKFTSAVDIVSFCFSYMCISQLIRNHVCLLLRCRPTDVEARALRCSRPLPSSYYISVCSMLVSTHISFLLTNVFSNNNRMTKLVNLRNVVW